MCRMNKTIRYRLIYSVPQSKVGLHHSVTCGRPSGSLLLNLLLCLRSQVFQQLHGLIFFPQGNEAMVVVVSAYGIDANTVLGEFGADHCHEAYRLETGVDIESDHLARKCVLDGMGIS